MKVVFSYAAHENLGVEYLSASLKRAGHSTSLVFDPQLFDDKFIKVEFLGKLYSVEKEIVKQILEKKPDLLALSVVSGDLSWAYRIAKAVKAQTNVPILFGGIHPSSVPEKVLENDFVDYIIIGEGEKAIVELANALGSKKNLAKKISKIHGLAYKTAGRVVKNKLSPPIQDLDSLPFPDKELFYSAAPFLKREYTIVTRRGCLNACTYCHNSIWKSLYGVECSGIRLRSVKNVMKELREAYAKYKFNRLRINDDIFTSHKSWLKEFADAYSKEFNVPFWCYVSPTTVDDETAELLKKAHCYQVSLGVQSINPELRKKILHRYETNEQIATAISALRKNNIRCITDNMLGLPEQEEDELLDLAKFYLKNRVDRICIYWLIYFPKTKIVDIAQVHGNITQKQLDNIESEPIESANTILNEYNNKKFIKYHLLLLATTLLPTKITTWIIEKKIYEKFPAINPSIIENPITFFMNDRKEIERVRFVKRYLYYGIRIPFQKLLKF
ncbi:MAG: radical SAM protein [archaeon]|jgi:radical SAM superfamily enzyme YgiQ (UPF0313 family)